MGESSSAEQLLPSECLEIKKQTNCLRIEVKNVYSCAEINVPENIKICIFKDYNKCLDLETSSILLGNETCFAAQKENLHKSTTKSYIGLNMCKSLCHKLSELSAVHT